MTKIKVRRYELRNLVPKFKLINPLKGFDLTYPYEKNKREIIAEVRLWEKTLDESKDFQEYSQKRIGVCEKFCDRDDKNKPIMIGTPPNQRYVGLETHDEFQAEWDKLKKKYKKAIDEQQEKLDDFNKKMDVDIEFEMHLIPKNVIPFDLPDSQMEVLFLMIDPEGDPPEPKKEEEKAEEEEKETPPPSKSE